MKDEKIKSISNQIVALEIQCHEDPEHKDNYIAQMDNLIKDLSLAELLAVDIYIEENNLLKE